MGSNDASIKRFLPTIRALHSASCPRPAALLVPCFLFINLLSMEKKIIKVLNFLPSFDVEICCTSQFILILQPLLSSTSLTCIRNDRRSTCYSISVEKQPDSWMRKGKSKEKSLPFWHKFANVFWQWATEGDQTTEGRSTRIKNNGESCEPEHQKEVSFGSEEWNSWQLILAER